MPASDRSKYAKARLAAGLVVAIAFCALWLGFGLLQSSYYEREARAKADEYSRYTSDKVAEACIGVTRLERIKCLYEATDAQSEYEYNQADLVAQRQSALWAYVMAAAAVIGMALSAVGVWLVFTTFRETRRSADISHNLWVIERERLKEGKEARFQIPQWRVESVGPDISIRAEYFNVGGTEAKNIRISVLMEFRAPTNGYYTIFEYHVPIVANDECQRRRVDYWEVIDFSPEQLSFRERNPDIPLALSITSSVAFDTEFDERVTMTTMHGPWTSKTFAPHEHAILTSPIDIHVVREPIAPGTPSIPPYVRHDHGLRLDQYREKFGKTPGPANYNAI